METNIAVQHIKLSLSLPSSNVMVLVQVPATILMTQLPAYTPGKAGDNGQILEPLPSSSKTSMEFLASAFDLAQTWLLQSLGSELIDGRVFTRFDCVFVCHPAFQINILKT